MQKEALNHMINAMHLPESDIDIAEDIAENICKECQVFNCRIINTGHCSKQQEITLDQIKIQKQD